MGDQCDSHTPLITHFGGCEDNLTFHSQEECKQESISFNENGDFPAPQVGMVFSSESEVRSYYSDYGKHLGFRTITRTSRKGRDGKVKYLILECAGEAIKAGKSAARKRYCEGEATKAGNSAGRKRYCEAKINVTLRKDGTYRINTVRLSHTHDVSSDIRIKDIVDMRGKRTWSQKDVNMHVKRICSEQNGCRNKERRLLGEGGDGEALQKFLVRMQEQDRNFFYAIDLDDLFSLRNVFWADGRSRAAYESFGDVVMVDTTCISNSYRVPLVTFVGVNHHGHSILFGCGLLSCEDSESFVWLFQSLLHCMSGVPPQGIITDHCKVMQKAVENVYPSTRHCWCSSNIIRKLSQQIHGHDNYKSLGDLLQNVIYDTPTSEFEGKWRKIMEEFGLQHNKWLQELFLEQHLWVPSFVKSEFWAGMCINLHSESTHAFFDGYVNHQTTLKQFVDQYENALQYKAEKEYVADIHSSCSSQGCVTKSPIERQFQSAYTHAKFVEVQHEFVGKADCNVSVAHNGGSICHYNVIEDEMIGDKPKESLVEVTYNRLNCDVQCNCRLFEFRGILCRHSLAVLSQERVKEVPDKYILDRWRKNIRRKYAYIKTSYGVQQFKPHVERLESLCNQFSSVAESAAEFEDTSSFVKVTLCNLKEKLEAWTTRLRNSSQV